MPLWWGNPIINKKGPKDPNEIKPKLGFNRNPEPQLRIKGRR